MKKILFIAPLLTTLLLSGCSSDERAIPASDHPLVDASVPLVVESGTLETGTVTRASSTLPDGESIGIFLAGAGYMPVSNRQYTRTSGTWGPEGGAANTIYLGGATANVCAYHPWTSGLSNSGAIPLTSQEYVATEDISFATNESVDGTKSGKSVSFAMKRAYARIKFTVQRSNYSGKGEVQALEVSNLLPSASLDITSGDYSPKDGTAATTVSIPKTLTMDATAVSDYADFLIVPCTPAGTGMSVKLTVDGQPMTTTLGSGDYTPKAGEWKTVNISVQGTAINVSSVSVEDWSKLSTSDIVPKP